MNKNLRRIKIFSKDPNKKITSVIFKEVLTLWIIKKRFPLHYFGRFLYRKDSGYFKDYLDMNEYNSIIHSEKLNNKEYLPFLNNKLSFSFFCEKYKIPQPRILGYNFKKSFFHGENVNAFSSHQELFGYFNSCFKLCTQNKIFLKPLDGFGGKGILTLNRENLEQQLKSHARQILNSSYIHQQGIVQHHKINQIYPDSVNTIRIDTYIDDLGEINILGIAMRFGSGGKSVDNISSGGFFVPVDSNQGTLTEKGTQAMIYGGTSYYKHPDTEFIFKDFKIPFFSESLKLCKDLATYIPNRLSGWDIAITEEGPIVIEGNHTPYILMGEIAYGGYVKHPLYKELIANSK